MATILRGTGSVDSSLPIEDFSQLMGVFSQLTACLNLVVEVVVVVLLLMFLHHFGVESVVSLAILLVSA